MAEMPPVSDHFARHPLDDFQEQPSSVPRPVMTVGELHHFLKVRQRQEERLDALRKLVDPDLMAIAELEECLHQGQVHRSTLGQERMGSEWSPPRSVSPDPPPPQGPP
jgi:hypothetical protein